MMPFQTVHKLTASTAHDLPIATLHELSNMYKSAVDEEILSFRSRLVMLGCALGDPSCVLTVVLHTPSLDRQTPLYEYALSQIKAIIRKSPTDFFGLRAALIMNQHLMQEDPQAGRLEAEKLLELFDDLPDNAEHRSLHAKLLCLTALAEMQTRKDKAKAKAYLEKAAFQFDDAAAYSMLSRYMEEDNENSTKMAEYSIKATASGILEASLWAGLARYTDKRDAIREKWINLPDRRMLGLIKLRQLARLFFPTGAPNTPSIRGMILRVMFQLETWTWDTSTSAAKEWLLFASAADIERAPSSLRYMELVMGEKAGEMEMWVSSQDPSLSPSDQRDAAYMAMNVSRTMEEANQQFLRSMGIHDSFTFTGKRII